MSANFIERRQDHRLNIAAELVRCSGFPTAEALPRCGYGDKLLMLAQDAATIETRTGARQTYRRKPSDPGRVLAWELTQ